METESKGARALCSKAATAPICPKQHPQQTVLTKTRPPACPSIGHRPVPRNTTVVVLVKGRPAGFAGLRGRVTQWIQNVLKRLEPGHSAVLATTIMTRCK
ncbi:unnamed protein product [Sphagnum balticum]